MSAICVVQYIYELISCAVGVSLRQTASPGSNTPIISLFIKRLVYISIKSCVLIQISHFKGVDRPISEGLNNKNDSTPGKQLSDH